MFCSGRVRLSRLKKLSQYYSQAAADSTQYDYDLIVVGGGSGGLACSKEAALLGKKVAVLDYVSPSAQGTTWGLGGTCVNVGCIPKKLMHQAALLGQAVKDASFYGWTLPHHNQITHSWETLRSGVVNHIKSLNWGHRVQLMQKNVDYFNAHGSFVDPHTIEACSKEGTKTKLTSRYVVIAVGGRPKYPSNVHGAVEHSITSDDLFYLKKPPGKTLVVGASYVALECAGFLAGLGYPTSLMVRSKPLKAFDEELASHVVASLENHGVQILAHSEPKSMEKLSDDRIAVSWYDTNVKQDLTDDWETVLVATGRKAHTVNLHLSKAGVESLSESGKIVVDDHEASNIPNVFAIGDAAMNGGWELTPVAIKAGKLLAQRLFGGSTQLMNYDLVPTTVFTPLELSAVGLTEYDAIKTYGTDNVEVYHAYYKPLEFYLPERDASHCYIKMVCVKNDNSSTEKVVGLHMTGPNAGEMMQGFAVAMRRAYLQC